MRVLGPGALVGSWLVEERRGRGGFAEVFRARHVSDGRLGALKVLGGDASATPQHVRRFEQEGALLAHLDHPGIPAVLDRGVGTDGRPWLVMAWIDGPDLAAELARRGRLPAAEAVALVAAVADALAAAHAAGVVHRDVKPANVLLEPGPAGPRARLVDFGVARALLAELAVVHTRDSIVGTPRHMAPEQLRGQAVDARTDVYALALLAFELLTGRPAFAGTDAAELEAQHLGAPPPRVSEHAPVPAALDAPLLAALAKDPAARPGDPRELAAALVAALQPAAASADAPAATLTVEAALADDVDEPDDADLRLMAEAVAAARATCLGAGLSIVAASGVALVARAASPEAARAAAASVAARTAPALARTRRVVLRVRLD